MSTFGNNLRKYRETHGLTQAELAELLGTSKQVVSRYENGQRSPKISVVSHFAAALGMTIAELSAEEKLPDVPPDTAYPNIPRLIGRVFGFSVPLR